MKERDFFVDVLWVGAMIRAARELRLDAEARGLVARASHLREVELRGRALLPALGAVDGLTADPLALAGEREEVAV